MLVAVMMLGLIACGSAGAWGIPKIPGLGGGASAGADPDAFLARVKASEALVNKSADQLFSLVASKEEQAKIEEQQKKINAATDAKEKDALISDMTSSQFAAIERSLADNNLQAEAAKWDSQKKQMAANSLFNLALGGKMAADLVPQGKNLANSIKTNPLLLTKVRSLYEAVKSLGGIGTGTARIMSALQPVFSAAKIDVKLPASSAEAPKSVEL
jgi:hypothetical protein